MKKRLSPESVAFYNFPFIWDFVNGIPIKGNYITALHFEVLGGRVIDFSVEKSPAEVKG